MQIDAKINTGDIVLIKFHPGYGNEFKKYRPAVIMSETITKIDPRFILIAPLTTNIKTEQPELELIIDNPSLDKKSLLLTWYQLTIDSSRLIRKLGTLSDIDKNRVFKAVTSLYT